MNLSEIAPQNTVREALIGAIKQAGEYKADAETAPIAILWPDGARQWIDVVPKLRGPLTILSLGEYDETTLTGPAIWIRAELARLRNANEIPVVYLPGYSKDVLRHVEEAPTSIEPLVYLQYRGAMFLQQNGKDWTLSSFLQNVRFGLGLSVDGSEATRSGLLNSAPRLLDQRVGDLRNHAGGIDADFLDTLLFDDMPRGILEWINDEDAMRRSLDEASWNSFTSQLRSRYYLDPAKDGAMGAAQRLGEAASGTAWGRVWDRFAESPSRFPAIPAKLRGAKPVGTVQTSLFGDSTIRGRWPQDNDEQESALRAALGALSSTAIEDARFEIARLEREHGWRRGTVWAELGEASLAFALQHLAALAKLTENPMPAGDPQIMIEAYVSTGWEIDAAALDAAVAVSRPADRAAVDCALQAVYIPWLRQTAIHFQAAVASMPLTFSHKSFAPGTCVVFADGLRYDLAARLNQALLTDQFDTTLAASVGPLPGVTATAKPAQSPVHDRFLAGDKLNTRGGTSGSTTTQPLFKNALAEAGWQVISSDGTGSPATDARGWTEVGEIDSQGHNSPHELPRHALHETQRIAQRVADLLSAGWPQVVVVTDHGWLLTPRPMEKTHLPEHLTDVRKGRCARIEPGAEVNLQSVPWYWDSDVRIAIAPGISCFEDGKRYEHGGISLQECVLPTIAVRGRAGQAFLAVAIADVHWRGLACTVSLTNDVEGFTVDIRREAAASDSTLVKNLGRVEAGGARVVVRDFSQEGETATIVVLNENNDVVAQRAIVVGGEGE